MTMSGTSDQQIESDCGGNPNTANELEDDSSPSRSTASSIRASRDSSTLQDVMHYHYFGRPGQYPSTKTTRHLYARKIIPFAKVVSTPWQLDLSEEVLLRLLYGYLPTAMDEKWLIYADGPTADGHAVVNFHRSWTGAKVAELVLSIETADDGAGLWKGKVVELRMEGNQEEATELLEKAELSESELNGNERIPDDETGTQNPLPDPGDLTNKMTNLQVKENVNAAEDCQNSQPDVEVDDENEDEESWVKFQVITACNSVMNIDIGEDAKEPESWSKMATLPPNQKTDRGGLLYLNAYVSEETEEMLKRAGPDADLTFDGVAVVPAKAVSLSLPGQLGHFKPIIP